MRFRSYIACALATALLTGCAGQSDRSAGRGEPSFDAMDLQIRIGRLAVMTDQAQDAISVLDNQTSMSAPEVPMDEEAQDFFEQLHYVLFRYNSVHVEACAQGWLDDGECKGSFQPGWLKRSKTDTPSLSDLDRWTEDLQERVVALRSVVCAPAAERTGNEYFCTVE